MHIIKPCPSCGVKLRFPIDKGTVKVRCRCGYSFVADPDNPVLYVDAVFDITHKKKKQTHQLFTQFTLKTIIEKIYAYWYVLLNFPLMPTKDKIKIIFIITLIVSVIILILYYLFSPTPQPPAEGIVL